MEDQKNITKKGGTMRLGAYPCVLEKEHLQVICMVQKKYLRDTDTDMNLTMIIKRR